MLAEVLLNSAGQKNFQQLATERFFFESKTVARELLGDCASALAHVAGCHIFQRCTDDPKNIVSAVLIKFCVLHRDDCVDEIARQLIIWDRLAIFDVDLTKDLAVSVENHARRFHLFEFI